MRRGSRGRPHSPSPRSSASSGASLASEETAEAPRGRARMFAAPGARSVAVPRQEDPLLDNIIVGVDGQEGGRDAIALAARLAPLTGAHIVLVHAYPNDPRPFRGSNLDYDRAVRED